MRWAGALCRSSRKVEKFMVNLLIYLYPQFFVCCYDKCQWFLFLLSCALSPFHTQTMGRSAWAMVTPKEVASIPTSSPLTSPLLPLWFSEKYIFLVPCLYFPLFSLSACKKKPSISQDLLTWTLAPMFWKWNLINCCRKNGMGMFLISSFYEATSHPST